MHIYGNQSRDDQIAVDPSDMKKKIKKITRLVFAMREWRRRAENGTHGTINLLLVDRSFVRSWET